MRTVPMPLCAACVDLLWKLPRPVSMAGGPRLTVALGAYQGPLGRALLNAKTRGRRRVLRGLGEWAAERIHRRLPVVDAVVPVPSSMRRGVDTAWDLAGPIARRLGVPRVELVKRISMDGQRGRDALERRVHAAAAYRAPVADGQALPDRVLLVDDVFTTGATMRACTDELLGAGVRRVYGVALAVAMADDLDGVEHYLDTEVPRDDLWSILT